MTREEFLVDVKHEIDMLKKHATREELDKLDFYSLCANSRERCIYGQLTGFCESDRAKELMDLCCIRQWQSSTILDFEFTLDQAIELDLINGPYDGTTWQNDGYFSRRTYQYLSALEGYISSKEANNADIIRYLKGEIETLTL